MQLSLASPRSCNDVRYILAPDFERSPISKGLLPKPSGIERCTHLVLIEPMPVCRHVAGPLRLQCLHLDRIGMLADIHDNDRAARRKEGREHAREMRGRCKVVVCE